MLSFSAITYCQYHEHNITQQKEQGAVWFDAKDNCLVYSCAAGVGALPQAHIVVTQIDCSEFYCDVVRIQQKYISYIKYI